MKKAITLALALTLMLSMGGALADIKLVAVEDGRVTGRAYGVGDPFSLRVSYDLPPYIDMMYHMTVVEICGVTVDQPDIPVKSGEYVILGQIECFPAYVTVSIEDIATGEEIDSATYHFRERFVDANKTSDPDEIVIPNTGGSNIAAPLIISAVCITTLFIGRKRR